MINKGLFHYVETLSVSQARHLRLVLVHWSSGHLGTLCYLPPPKGGAGSLYAVLPGLGTARPAEFDETGENGPFTGVVPAADGVSAPT